MRFGFIALILGLWMIIQALTHDSYWFNVILNSIVIIAFANSIWFHYEKSKRR